MSYIDQINDHIQTYQRERHNYPALDRSANPLPMPEAPVLGRQRELKDLRLGLRNPEKANVILLGDPGSGKTALVKGFSWAEESANYMTLQVDVERLAQNSNADKDAELANGLLNLVEETKTFSHKFNIIVILFIDEFHRIAMLSPSAVEALKPILEKSAVNGFRIIAATTFEEYNDWIAPNRALDQRLLRMDLPELSRNAVINILKSRSKQYGVYDLASPNIFEEIYDTSKQILLSNSQPRASLDILLNIVGNLTKDEKMVNGELVRSYYTASELNINSDYALSRPLLNRVIQRSYGIDIDNRVDIKDLRKAIRTRIFNQNQASEAVLSLLEMSLAGFNDPTRPKISFLSTGPTGTGKTEMAKVISETMQIPLKRFDMSRYPRPEDAVDFANQLANAAWSAPNAYILIDEVDKSTRECMNTLLQVLDDARLTSPNNPNRVISFSGNIINLTTNIASDIYQHQARFGKTDKNGEGYIDTETVYKALADSAQFNSAVLGRIDLIVPFSPLPKVAIAAIVQRELDSDMAIAETRQRRIFISPDIVPHLVIDRTSNDSERGGARDAKRNVKNLVIRPLAHAISDSEEELPLVVYLTDLPRFRDPNQPDVKTPIKVESCYSFQQIDQWLAALSTRIGRPIKNAGCFVPRSINPNAFIKQVVRQVQAGSTSVKTTMDIKRVMVIDGNANLDVANNERFIH